MVAPVLSNPSPTLPCQKPLKPIPGKREPRFHASTCSTAVSSDGSSCSDVDVSQSFARSLPRPGGNSQQNSASRVSISADLLSGFTRDQLLTHVNMQSRDLELCRTNLAKKKDTLNAILGQNRMHFGQLCFRSWRELLMQKKLRRCSDDVKRNGYKSKLEGTM